MELAQSRSLDVEGSMVPLIWARREGTTQDYDNYLIVGEHLLSIPAVLKETFVGQRWWRIDVMMLYVYYGSAAAHHKNFRVFFSFSVHGNDLKIGPAAACTLEVRTSWGAFVWKKADLIFSGEDETIWEQDGLYI